MQNTEEPGQETGHRRHRRSKNPPAFIRAPVKVSNPRLRGRAASMDEPGAVKLGMVMDDVIQAVKGGTKPINFVLLGTEWAPPCRYTLDTLRELMKVSEYRDKIEAFFVDQDSNFAFCAAEKIAIGFPTLFVFVNGFLANFVADGQLYDPTRSDQRMRLVRQLNMTHMKEIADGAFAILEGRARSLTCSSA
jgi:thiol-disulfide isomerase/thioredoxin